MLKRKSKSKSSKSAKSSKPKKAPKAKKSKKAKKARKPKDTTEYQKQRWNVYTSMLMLSLFAIILAITCLWLDFEKYDRDMDAKAARGRVSRTDTSLRQQRAVVMRADDQRGNASVRRA